MPLASTSTNPWPGSPSCMPVPRVPYAAETVPSSSRKGVATPRRSRSALIWSAVFITIGTTAMPASAKPRSFSISAICSRHASHPAPSLKYRITGVPRMSDNETVRPSLVGSVNGGAVLTSLDTTGREDSRAAVTNPVMMTSATTQVLRVTSSRRLATACWVCLIPSSFSWRSARRRFAVPEVMVLVLVRRGRRGGGRVARGGGRFLVVVCRWAAPAHPALGEGGPDEDGGHGEDPQPQDEFGDRAQEVLDAREDPGEGLARRRLESAAPGHLGRARERDHERPHHAEGHGDRDVQGVRRDQPAGDPEPDRLGPQERLLAQLRLVPDQGHHEQREHHAEDVGDTQGEPADRRTREHGQGHHTGQYRSAAAGGDD